MRRLFSLEFQFFLGLERLLRESAAKRLRSPRFRKLILPSWPACRAATFAFLRSPSGRLLRWTPPTCTFRSFLKTMKTFLKHYLQIYQTTNKQLLKHIKYYKHKNDSRIPWSWCERGGGLFPTLVSSIVWKNNNFNNNCL